MPPAHGEPRHRRAAPSLGVSAHPERSPPLSALFLIDFDVRAGYTIRWKRALPGVELDDRVEYKSLPSGLHTVYEDVYFVDEDAHAGLSAFVNEPCEDEALRHARMIAVGILVPLSYGRLGRAWKHVENLKSMAYQLASDRMQMSVLQQYWENHKAQEGQSFEAQLSAGYLPNSPLFKTQAQNGQASSAENQPNPSDSHKLSPNHPAWSLPALLRRFGTLLFPIHRAALLRKRILLSCHAPIHQVCDFVYDISLLSNIPFSVSANLPAESQSSRLRPLFSIGVHDIPYLEHHESTKRNDTAQSALDDTQAGWIACMTDSILASKDNLWDVLVTLPPQNAASAAEQAWPTIECPQGNFIKATQRDLRRFNNLRAGLARLAEADALPDPASPTSQTLPQTPDNERQQNAWTEPIDALDHLTEPLSWAALAYNGYMWWASAGEQLRTDDQEESFRDASLLAGLARPSLSFPSQPDALADSITSLTARCPAAADPGEARVEVAIITYFHRLTAQLLSVLADHAEEALADRYHDDTSGTEEDDDAQEDRVLLRQQRRYAASDDFLSLGTQYVEAMGLDVWSAVDAEFVSELAASYFGVEARVEGKGVEVCGVRVC